MKKPLAVLDTNIIISGLILPKSNPGRIMRLWKSNKFDLITSTPVLIELERVLSYPKISMKYSITTTAIDDMLNKIKKNSNIISQLKLPRVLVRDKEDLIIIATALDGKADYLVTGDNDLLAVKNDSRLKPLKIITTDEFLEQINKK